MDYIIPDIEEMTKKYKSENGGICGQACLAVITRSSIRAVLDMWEYQGLVFKGWSGWKQLRKYLEKLGYSVKQINGKFQYNPERYYIARVQWLGDGNKKDKPFYGWNHWSVASAYTHFIIIEKFRFFCNETGWDDYSNLRKYLIENKGVITSYLEIGNKKGSL